MSDYEEQIDDETKVAIGAEFMKYAPPGEFNEVYNDVAKLLANEELLKQATSEVKWSWLINYYSLKHNRVKTVKTSLSNRSIVQSVNLDIFWSFAITVTNFTGFQTNKTIRRDITVKIEFYSGSVKMTTGFVDKILAYDNPIYTFFDDSKYW